MFIRHAQPLVLEALADTRVVFVGGARQVGKSTLAREIARGDTADLRDREQWLRLPAGRRPAPPKPREGSRQMWLLPALPPELRETQEVLPRAWEHLGMIEMLAEPSHARHVGEKVLSACALD